MEANYVRGIAVLQEVSALEIENSLSSMASFPTGRQESWRTRLFRWAMNLFPTYMGTGGRVTFISADWQEIHVRLSLNLFTYNYVGVVFGGSIYASVDPFYMLQLMHILGKDYIVWDKAAYVRFIRPIRRRVYARFLIDTELIDQIRQRVAREKEIELTLPVTYIDRQGIQYAHIDKVIYIAQKTYYKQKRSNIQTA